MIYPKEYLEEMVRERSEEKAYKQYPFRSWVNADRGEKTANQLIFYNLETFFDLSSEELKKKMYESRVEILNNCFKSEWVDDFFVNNSKINQCIHNTENKHFGKYRETKYLYHFNNLDKLNNGLISIRDNDVQTINEYSENFLFDSFKIKYFFKEQMDKNLI